MLQSYRHVTDPIRRVEMLSVLMLIGLYVSRRRVMGQRLRGLVAKEAKRKIGNGDAAEEHREGEDLGRR